MPTWDEYYQSLRDQTRAAQEGRWTDVHDVMFRERLRNRWGLPSWRPGMDDEDYGAGQDWWSRGEPFHLDPSNYEQILQNLYRGSIADPQQRATRFGASVLGGTGYKDVLNDLYEAAGAKTGRPSERPEALKRLAQMGSPLLGAIMQTHGARDQAFTGATTGALGPATSMVGMGYSGLQGFRGQDMQRYLTEMQTQTQLQMAQMQARAQAAAMQGRGGGIWDILGSLMGFVPMIGDMYNMFGGGGGNSPGGGIQYGNTFNWGGGY